jgi:hypothetical protein
MRKRVRGTPETATLWEPVEVVPGSARRLRLWRAAAVVVLGAGMLGAVFTADVVARNGVDQSRRAFVTTSAGIASMLELDIQHEEDLSVSVGAFVAGKPDASNADFTHWLNSLRAFERYAELEGVGFSIIVPAAQLAAFATRAATDPVGPLSADGTFQVLPPGDRPYYCLAALGRPAMRGSRFPPGTTSVPRTHPSRLAIRDLATTRRWSSAAARCWPSRSRSIATAWCRRASPRVAKPSLAGWGWWSRRVWCWPAPCKIIPGWQ